MVKKKAKSTISNEMPAKRSRFVDEYVKDCNGMQAAIRAGYSKKGADRQAAFLLGIIEIKKAVDEKLSKIAEKSEMTAGWVIDKAKKIVERCMQAEPVLDKEGCKTGEYKFDSAGANGSLKILAKYLGMEKTTVSVEGTGLGIVLHLTGKKAEPDNGKN